MRKIFGILLLYIPFSVSSQTSYVADIDRLYEAMQKTPSYKDQVKGEKKQQFEQLYQSLRQDSSMVVTDYDKYLRLVQLFFLIRDNHFGFYQLLRSYPDKASLADSSFVQSYRASPEFIQYPSTNINIDSLREKLAAISKDSIEGIYYYDKYLTVGLYRTNKRDSLMGVVLSTNLPHWQPGQIAIWLREYSPAKFRAVYGHPLHKYLILFNNEKFLRHALINSSFYASITESVYKKDTAAIDHAIIPRSSPPFLFRALTNNVQYIRIGHFSAMNKDIQAADDFYARYTDSVTAPHLIVDLRNNGGGAKKVSDKLLRVLRNYSRQGKIYVLVNNSTISEGERFAIHVRSLPNTKVYGETTNGMLAYGNNAGKRVTLPGGTITFYVTDMSDPDGYLRYEDIGVQPDQWLDAGKDWIEQVLSIIAADHK